MSTPTGLALTIAVADPSLAIRRSLYGVEP
jgi:hypothetical protein